jgi:hypothetical protein
MYFGLLYQKGQDANIYSFHTTALANQTFAQLLGIAHARGRADIEAFQDLVREIIDHTQEVNEYLTALKTKAKADIDYNDYYKLYNASLDILETGLKFTKLLPVNIDVTLQNNIAEQAEKWIGMGRTAGELYIDVRTKNYSSAVVNTTSLIDQIFESNPATISNTRKLLLKYGNFTAAIAQAKNSDEVEAAIEAAVLPVGSSSVKRETKFNISLNAFVGGFAGAEYLPALQSDKTAFTAGLTAPVGIAFSWGKIRSKKNLTSDRGGKSFSIFVPLIDIGTVAAYRFKDDRTEISSDIRLKDIVSPGLYFYWGFGKCPISLGAGAQLGPQIRNISAGVPKIESKNIYVRYGLTLTVDIPLLNFYTKN